MMKRIQALTYLRQFVVLMAVLGSLALISTPTDTGDNPISPPGAQRNASGVQSALDGNTAETALNGSAGPLRAGQLAPMQQSHVWSALANNGLDAEVIALAAVGSDLYVGGEFTQTADGTVTNLINIARYDTVAKTWSPLANNGLTGYVAEISVVGSYLYVGGSFNQTADGAVTNLGNIARYDLTSSSWSALANNGLNDDVYAITATGTDLYVGGGFSQTADGSVVSLGNIAHYSLTTNAWSSLPNNGLDAYVSDLAIAGGELYAVGIFDRTADGTVILNAIARYDGATWSALPNNGFDSNAWVLAVVGSDVYVGGAFTGTGDLALSLNHIAKYDPLTNTWSPLPNGGLNDNVYALAASGDDLYAGGMFTQSSDGAVISRWIARYDLGSSTWYPLSNGGLAGGTFYLRVEDLAFVGSDLYGGGDFTRTADSAIDLNYVARYAAEPAALPETGFRPDGISPLPAQPEERAYTDPGDLWLEIPRLGIQVPIVGVPMVNGEWDVSWLGNRAGYLEGTAFPTWPGNTAITAHVWNASNNPGPFVDLKQLRFGDQIRIHAWDQVYIYEVRESYLVFPRSLSPLRHEEYDWVSLITCERYDLGSDKYVFRRTVRAVLMDVSEDKAVTFKQGL